MPIPKKIWAIWVGDKPMPELVSRCLESQRIPGYEHRLITSADALPDNAYLNECLEAKNWVKAGDWLRFHLLREHGGIYLDADTEVLPGKNFDDLLDNSLFACREDNGFVANGIVGAVPNHPVVLEHMRRVETNFRGSGDMVFEAGMEVFTNVIGQAKSSGIRILPSDFCFPYNHQTGLTRYTLNTRVFHHYLKSWVK